MKFLKKVWPVLLVILLLVLFLAYGVLKPEAAPARVPGSQSPETVTKRTLPTPTKLAPKAHIVTPAKPKQDEPPPKELSTNVPTPDVPKPEDPTKVTVTTDQQFPVTVVAMEPYRVAYSTSESDRTTFIALLISKGSFTLYTNGKPAIRTKSNPEYPLTYKSNTVDGIRTLFEILQPTFGPTKGSKAMYQLVPGDGVSIEPAWVTNEDGTIMFLPGVPFGSVLWNVETLEKDGASVLAVVQSDTLGNTKQPVYEGGQVSVYGLPYTIAFENTTEVIGYLTPEAPKSQ